MCKEKICTLCLFIILLLHGCSLDRIDDRLDNIQKILDNNSIGNFNEK